MTGTTQQSKLKNWRRYEGWAFKTHPVARGKAIRDRRKPDFIAKTARGIRDRVLVLWPEEEYGWSYEESDVLEVISESR